MCRLLECISSCDWLQPLEIPRYQLNLFSLLFLNLQFFKSNNRKGICYTLIYRSDLHKQFWFLHLILLNFEIAHILKILISNELPSPFSFTCSMLCVDFKLASLSYTGDYKLAFISNLICSVTCLSIFVEI